MAKNTRNEKSDGMTDRSGSARTQVVSDRSGHYVTRKGHCSDYGEVRPEVKDIIESKMSKHATTWTELAKR